MRSGLVAFIRAEQESMLRLARGVSGLAETLFNRTKLLADSKSKDGLICFLTRVGGLPSLMCDVLHRH